MAFFYVDNSVDVFGGDDEIVIFVDSIVTTRTLISTGMVSFWREAMTGATLNLGSVGEGPIGCYHGASWF